MVKGKIRRKCGEIRTCDY